MSNTKKAHPHAEFLRAIADGDSVDEWVGTIGHQVVKRSPTYFSDYILRGDLDITMSRNPRTININGIEVPEPLREAPDAGSEYYVPNIHIPSPYRLSWEGKEVDFLALRAGLAHRTKEAAETHVRALLSFTKVSDGE